MSRSTRMHGLLTLAWLIFAPVAMLTHSLRSSVPLLVGISVYANLAGHWAAFEASRADDYQRSKL
jgi:hypothetical protein